MNRRENAQTRTSGGRYLRVGAALIICAGCLPLVTSAQAPPPTFDGSLGAPGVAPLLPVDNPATGGLDYEIPAARGQAVGGNLFHSFSEFNINAGESATYTAPQPFDNVISRVIGNNPTSVDGLLRSEIPGANFWFINPNGIAFGPDASLDVLGGFHASTAEAVRFDSGESYEATAPAGTILTVANPIGFGFLDAEVGSISVSGRSDNRAELRVRAGQPISMVGGFGTSEGIDDDFRISDGNIGTSDSELIIVSVDSAGEIDLNLGSENGAVLSGFTGLGSLKMEDAMIRNDAFREGAITTIELVAERITLWDGEIASIGSGTASAGDVRLNTNFLNLFDSRISVATTGSGAGGKLEVFSDQILPLRNSVVFVGSSELNSDSTGTGPNAGKAGDISIVAQRVNVEEFGSISATTIDGGGGSISLNVDKLALLSGGTISAGTTGTGNAGEILIRGTLLVPYDDTRDPDFVLGDQFLDAGEVDRLLIPRDLLRQPGSHPFGVVAAFDTSLPPDSMDTPVELIARSGLETDGNRSPFGDRAPLVRGLVGATDDGLAIDVSGGPDFDFIGNHDEAGSYTINAQWFDPDNLPAWGYVVVDGFGSGIFNSSMATGPAAGKAGDISIMATSIEIARYGTISATTIDGDGGAISLNADDLILRSGGAIRAGTTGTGDAGVIVVQGLPDFGGGDVGAADRFAKSVTIGGQGAGMFNNSEAIHSDAGPAGAAGSISVSADTLVVRNQGQIVATTVDGRGGQVTLDAGRLEVRSNGQVAASTGGSGTGGTVTVNADEVEVRGFDPEAGDCGSDCDVFREPEVIRGPATDPGESNNGEDDAPTDSPLEILTAFFGTGIFSNSTAKGADAGRGGDVKITARAVTVSDGGEIGANTVDGPGGEIRIAGVRGDDGEPLTTVSVLRGGRIWANSEGLGRGGTINLGSAAEPLKSVTVEGESQDRLQRPNLLAAFYRRFDLPDYRFTSSSPLRPRRVDNVVIPGSEIDPGSNFNDLVGFVAAFEAPLEGDASPLVARSNFEFSSGGSPLADGVFGAPVVRGYFNADGSLGLDVEALRPDVIGDFAISFQVIDPVLILGRASSLSTRALAAGDAGSINVYADDQISVTQSAEITAQTSGPGTGGRVTLNSDLVSITDSGRLTADTTGAGRGGDIVVEARQLELSGGGRIQAGSRPEPINLVPAAAFDDLRYDLGRPADLRYDSSSGFGPLSPEEVQPLDFGLGVITEPTVYVAAFDVLEGDNTEPVDLIARSNFETADVGSPLPDSAPGPLVRGFVNAGDTVQLDVTGYADLLFKGDHRRSGDYAVLVQTQTVELLEAGDAGSITVTGRGGAGTAAQSISAYGVGSPLPQHAESVTISGGELTSSTTGSGSAGSVAVYANELSIEGTEAFRGGLFSESGTRPATTASARVQPEAVAPTDGDGDAGSILVDAGQVTITNNGQISVGAFGSGKAGNVVIQGLGAPPVGADSLLLRNGQIDAQALQGRGGSVLILTADPGVGTVRLDRGQILAVSNSADPGSQGSILIAGPGSKIEDSDNSTAGPRRVILQNQSLVSANSGNPNAGNATVNARVIAIDGSSAVRATGEVFTIGSVLGSIQEIPEAAPVDASDDLATRCSPAENEGRSTFLVRGTRPADIRAPYLPVDGLTGAVAGNQSVACASQSPR